MKSNIMRAADCDRYVGSRIRQRRVMSGLSQQQVADLIGTTYQQEHKYERGINRISAGRLYSIAQALDSSVAYFFEGFEFGSAAGDYRAAANVPRSGSQFHRHPQREAPESIGGGGAGAGAE